MEHQNYKRMLKLMLAQDALNKGVKLSAAWLSACEMLKEKRFNG